jgi:hypothetical protein
VRTAHIRESIAKSRRGKKSTPETKAKLKALCASRRKDPDWVSRVSSGTKRALSDPVKKKRHLEGVLKALSTKVHGRNFVGGKGDINITTAVAFYRELLCPLGYLMDKITVATGQGRGHHYTIDFALPEEKIAIEIDGPQHKYSPNKEHDQRRDAFLQSQGWKVIRVDA